MASLRKDPRGKSPYWYCVLTMPDGTRTTRSTGTKKWGEAAELCQKWQREQDHLKKGQRLENKEAVFETFITATQKAAKGEFTEATARQMLNQILEATGQAPMKLATIRTFLTDWANSKAVSKAVGTAKRYQHTVKTFLDHLDRKASANLASLTPKDVETFRDLQVKDGKSG